MTASLTTIDPSLPEGTGLELPPLHARFAQGSLVWFRSVPIPFGSPFWNVWKAKKLAFLERGFSTRKDGKTWILDQWLAGRSVGGRLQDGYYYLTKVGAEILDRAKREQLLPPAKFKSQPVFSELPKDLESKLRGYQVIPARQAYRSIRNGVSEWGYPGTVDASEMGTGKTFTTLAVALATGRKVAVFCPPVGIPGWMKAFAHFGTQPFFIETYQAVRGAWRPEIAKVDSNGQFVWSNPHEIVVILDECQALRYDDSLTYRCFSGLLRQGVPCIAASATLAVSPTELRFAGRVIGLHTDGDDWDRFCAQHGCERKSRNSPWVWNGDKSVMVRIQETMFPLRGCRIRKQDLGDQCPETEIQILPIVTPEAEFLHRSHMHSQSEIDALEKKKTLSPLKIEAMRGLLAQKMHQQWEMALVPHIANRVVEDVRNGWSVPVFVNFTQTRKALGSLLGTSDGFFGGQSPKKRADTVARFQDEKIHVLISNIEAGGASVSLHDVNGIRARRAYIFPCYKPIQFEQATGRVDRVGAMSKSDQFIPFLKGTKMFDIIKRIRGHMDSISALNDGSDAGGARF